MDIPTDIMSDVGNHLSFHPNANKSSMCKTPTIQKSGQHILACSAAMRLITSSQITSMLSQTIPQRLLGNASDHFFAHLLRRISKEPSLEFGIVDNPITIA